MSKKFCFEGMIMKKYVMLTADLHPIGGMQLYTAGKARFLKERGWDVYVLYSGTNEKNCAIDYLNEYTDGAFFCLAYRPAQLEKKTLSYVLNKIEKLIGASTSDVVFIESQAEVLALWGELIAEKINGQHICFNCNEQFRGPKKYYEENIKFFMFKYQRRELLGLHADTNKKLFDGYMNVPCSNEFVFDAVEPGPIQDVKNIPTEKLEKFDFNIAYLGRIIKGYVPNILEGVYQFANKYQEKSIQFIIIGDATDRKEEIDKLFNRIHNVKVTYMGDMVPIPRAIFKKIDAMIAGAVCAEISAREGVPTIVADCENYLANGILGYTINNSMYYDSQRGQSTYLEELEDALIYKRYLQNTYSFPPAISSDDIYESQFVFFDSANSKREYYDVLNIDIPKLSGIKKALVGLRTYAPRVYVVLRNIKRALSYN